MAKEALGEPILSRPSEADNAANVCRNLAEIDVSFYTDPKYYNGNSFYTDPKFYRPQILNAD
jgi:hypothetical protein